jgi:hypothetical protein
MPPVATPSQQSNPALQAFTSSITQEKLWAQVLIQSAGHTFSVRHIADRDLPLDKLRRLSVPDLRKLAMHTASGQFRPLRSSPDLPRGWTLSCNTPDELWRALQELYPGSIPDWFAAQSSNPPITHYRDFTNRQTGMYRITQLLTDDQAANVARAACHSRFCLKQRLWTVPGLASDSSAEKSTIPCLEPCAILLELARKTARIEQEDKLSVQFSRSEMQSFLAAVQDTLENSPASDRAGNIAAAANPRRLQLLLEKFKKYAAEQDAPEE